MQAYDDGHGVSVIAGDIGEVQYGHSIAGEIAPVDCRMDFGSRPVIVSEATAILLLEALREVQNRGGLRAQDADGARALMTCFDECALIQRHMAEEPIR